MPPLSPVLEHELESVDRRDEKNLLVTKAFELRYKKIISFICIHSRSV